MLTIAVLVLWTLPVIQGSTFIVANDTCQNQVTECLLLSKENTSVCGTDRITYSSQCQVILKQCQGESVMVDYMGPCAEETPCFDARRRASGPLQPLCNPDGTFSTIQCHPLSRYCRCVTPSGDGIPNTLSRYQKPLCHLPATQLSPKTIVKRSAVATIDLSPIWSQGGRCNPKNHIRFITSLTKTFEIEYNRTTLPNNTSITNITDHIISWKFNQLDTNADGYLDNSEYERLVKLAEKAVTPKKCARTLPRICDINKDKRISLNEWRTCLTNSSSDSLKLDRTGAILRDKQPLNSEEDKKGSINCSTKRSLILKYQQNTTQISLYVPECTDDGLYQSVQCYSGYCWCASEETGASIPETFLKGARPDCAHGPSPERVMKGCRRKHQDLIQEMLNVMENKFSSLGNNIEDDSRSYEERAATWMFFFLDLNKNKVLQRGREWKSIRRLVPDNRCAKKLPKFCDVNEDERVTLDEWLGCLNVAKQVKSSGPPRGINPLTLLRSD